MAVELERSAWQWERTKLEAAMEEEQRSLEEGWGKERRSLEEGWEEVEASPFSSLFCLICYTPASLSSKFALYPLLCSSISSVCGGYRHSFGVDKPFFSQHQTFLSSETSFFSFFLDLLHQLRASD